MRIPLLICVLLIAGCAAFLPYLNSYPEPYFDEAVFNNPAVRVAGGYAFPWPMAPDAPYRDLVWAYHGPFYPHLQVLTFKLLGVSMFACRLPQFLAAFAAVGILCSLLYRRGLRWGAVALAVLWLGDRALLEALYGRPDGLALLCLAFAFASFVRALETRALAPVFWSGLWAAASAGFHPATVPFAACMAMAYLWLFSGRRMKTIGVLALSAVIPVLAVLATVAPYFREAAAQFAFHRQVTQSAAIGYTMLGLIATLKWSRYWGLAVFGIAGLLAIPSVLTLVRRRSGTSGMETVPLFLAACLFAIAAFLSLAVTAAYTALFPYYLIFLSVWPVVALIASVDPRTGPPWQRRASIALLALLALAWFPSALWNLMRWREARFYARSSLVQSFEQQVRNVVPPGAQVKLSPEFFLIGRSFGPDAVRYPHDTFDRLPRSAWLVLLGTDIRIHGGDLAPGLRGRPVVFKGPLYPWFAKYSDSITIFGPST